MTKAKEVAVSRQQVRQMLGAITHETMWESAKHRAYICGDPVRRGVDGWPLLGRCTSAIKKGVFMLGGEKGRLALEKIETAKQQELARVEAGCGERLADWQPNRTPHWKRDPRVCLADIWGAVDNAYSNLQNGLSGTAKFRMAESGKPSDLASTLCDPKLPEGVAIGPGQASVLARELNDMESIRKLRFIANPAQIEALSNGSPGPKGSLMEAAFAKCERFQDEAYLFFAKQLARGNAQAMQVVGRAEAGMTVGKYAFEQVKAIVAPGTPAEQLAFDGVIVLDTKHRVSETFYYAMHAVTDYYGGLFTYWFARFMDGKLPRIPDVDYSREFAALAKRKVELTAKADAGGFRGRLAAASLRRLCKEEERMRELADPARRERAAEALEIVKKKSGSLIGMYEIVPGTAPESTRIYNMTCPLIRLDESMVPANVRHYLDRARKSYAKKMLPNRFSMQNLAALKESLLLILAGIGGIKIFEKAAHAFHLPMGLVAVVAEVAANACNGIADMLSGAVRKGPKGEGDEQAKAEHASKGALIWGLIGGTISSVCNYRAVGTRGALFAQSFFHSLAGNFTTQTVSQGGVWNGLFRKTARTLQKVGLLDSGINTNWESFKEVNIHNIFRLWQTVIGSTALWVSSFAIGFAGIIEDPSRAGAFGGMLLFLTAVLETPLAAVGIALDPYLNRKACEKDLLRALREAEKEERRE